MTQIDKSVKNQEVYQEKDIEYYSMYDLDKSLSGYYNLGTASYYADNFHLRKTANGEIFNMNEYSAAHRKLPFGTILKVRNLNNNKVTLVRINDRGPYIGNRIIDLSYRSAKAISGIGLPKVELNGLTAEDLEIPKDSLSEYYIGYSLYHSPVCLPKYAVIKNDSNKTFHYAVDNYKKKISEDNSLLLFVNAAEIHTKETGRDFRYYIGKFDSKIEKEKEILVENSN